MKRFPFAIAASVCVLVASVSPASDTTSELYSGLDSYVNDRVAEFDQISAERKAELSKLGEFAKDNTQGGKTARFTFVCTHNSRRSHMSQLWAAVAATKYGLNMKTYSGGTESTAFNPRAVAALKRAGMKVSTLTRQENPKYAVSFGAHQHPQVCFSKKYSDSTNPSEGFCAVMTCDSADKACPNVAGAANRIAITYVDPKVSDGTPEEAATYDERCAQIAREMLYAFSQVKKK